MLKLIRIADDCASAERSEDANLDPQKYYLARLQSIFCEVIVNDIDGKKLTVPKPMHLGLEQLSTQKLSMFPLNELPAFNDTRPLPYEKPVMGFLDAFEKIQTDEELLFLIEKYCHAVPAQTPVEFNGKQHLSRPDINLFDHLRTTAAIALCLYDEWKNGSWNNCDADLLNDSPSLGYKRKGFSDPCILISADLSGIQDFIFNIPSKGAAKSLKGRSFFVQLLCEVCAQLILDELNLKPVNLLYNGGGNFLILAPAYCKEQVENCAKKIVSHILKSEQSELYVAIASVSLGINDFHSFSAKWDEVKAAVNKKKRRKYQMLGVNDVFALLPQKARIDADPFIELSRLLATAKGYSIQKRASGDAETGWGKLFHALGYKVTFEEHHDTLCFNKTDFEGRCKGFRFAVTGLPIWHSHEDIERFEQKVQNFSEDEGESRQPGNIKTFVDLAGYAGDATGTAKIAVLKMDVDNLGKVFSEGLADNLRSPSRMMALSRSLKWFFEGYANTLIEKYDGQLYPIFSGGDDFFLLGAWDKVFDLAQEIREAFDEFVAHHPGITLSASLLVLDDHFPVSRFAAIAEERLHDAKYGSLNKNSINVFDQNLTWDEFKQAKEVKTALSELVTVYHESKAVIQKVLKGCDGLEVLHERAVGYARVTRYGAVTNLRERFEDQKPTGEKVWRMAYYLRDLKGESKEIAQKIVERYETVVFKAMQGEPVNPMYIAVGARWAELANRKREEKD